MKKREINKILAAMTLGISIAMAGMVTTDMQVLAAGETPEEPETPETPAPTKVPVEGVNENDYTNISTDAKTESGEDRTHVYDMVTEDVDKSSDEKEIKKENVAGALEVPDDADEDSISSEEGSEPKVDERVQGSTATSVIGSVSYTQTSGNTVTSTTVAVSQTDTVTQTADTQEHLTKEKADALKEDGYETSTPEDSESGPYATRAEAEAALTEGLDKDNISERDTAIKALLDSIQKEIEDERTVSIPTANLSNMYGYSYIQTLTSPAVQTHTHGSGLDIHPNITVSGDVYVADEIYYGNNAKVAGNVVNGAKENATEYWRKVQEKLIAYKEANKDTDNIISLIGGKTDTPKVNDEKKIYVWNGSTDVKSTLNLHGLNGVFIGADVFVTSHGLNGTIVCGTAKIQDSNTLWNGKEYFIEDYTATRDAVITSTYSVKTDVTVTTTTTVSYYGDEKVDEEIPEDEEESVDEVIPTPPVAPTPGPAPVIVNEGDLDAGDVTIIETAIAAANPAVLGARRAPEAPATVEEAGVLGARRAPQGAVLGARRAAKTGDAANMGAMMAMMTSSLAGLGGWTFAKKRREEEDGNDAE